MKLFKNKLTVTIVVLSVTFLGLIIYTASKDTKGLEGNAGELLNPMQRIIYNINTGAKNFVDFFLSVLVILYNFIPSLPVCSSYQYMFY